MPGCGLISLGIFGCLSSGCGRDLFSPLCWVVGLFFKIGRVAWWPVLGSGFGLFFIYPVCGLVLFGWIA